MTNESDPKRTPTKTTGWILLLPCSDRWASAISLAAEQEQVAIKQLASVDELLESVDLYQPCVIVVDFCETSPAVLNRLLEAVETPVFRSPIFAVGDNDLRDARLDLIKLGFSELFVSTAETKRLVRMADRYFKNAEPVSYPIEELVARDLPWG